MLELTKTTAVIVSPTPVRAVNPTPVYTPCVNPIPEAATDERLSAGPPKADILPSSLIPPFAWMILSPNVNALFVIAIDTNCV